MHNNVIYKSNEFLNYSQYLTNGISEGDNLLGFEFDLVAYICDEETCFHISHERTEDKNCMLILNCRFRDNATFNDIVKYLEKKWINYLCYDEFEKHYCEENNETINFYFVTKTANIGVTGKIEVT